MVALRLILSLELATVVVNVYICAWSFAAVSVPMEEEEDQLLNDPAQQMKLYIGDVRGIQGHQNSCYMDSTIFGLYALSGIFDIIFLEPNLVVTSVQSRKAVSELLWKGIVNPLRK